MKLLWKKWGRRQKETTKRAVTQIHVLEAKSNRILIFNLFTVVKAVSAEEKKADRRFICK